MVNFKLSKKAKAKWKKRWMLNVIGIHGLENPRSPPCITGGRMWLAVTIAKNNYTERCSGGVRVDQMDSLC